jgi:hypothetical protein
MNTRGNVVAAPNGWTGGQWFDAAYYAAVTTDQRIGAWERAAEQDGTVETNLTAIKAALADISQAELTALIAATNGVPPIAYGLLVWTGLLVRLALDGFSRQVRSGPGLEGRVPLTRLGAFWPHSVIADTRNTLRIRLRVGHP